MRKKKRKIPKTAIEPLMRHCEFLSKESDQTAEEIFKEYLELMNKYADYFFSEPWPKKYDYEKATTFTDEDIEFLTEGEKEEGADRFTAMLLKKNINLEHGFMELFGPFWTRQAFHKEFIRPTYEPVQEAFDDLSGGDKDSRGVLDKLKEKFDIRLIHDSLVDLAEHEYFDKITGRLHAGILELLHEEEGLPPCHEYRCKLARKSLHNGGDGEREENFE